MQESLNELATALAKAQGELQKASKDGTNPHFKSSFATLTACWEVIREPFSKNGLSILQPTVIIEGRLYLRTILLHASGQSLQGEYLINPIKNDPQGMGSALSYARRYCLKAMVGIADDEGEDDGHAASEPNGNQTRPNFNQNETSGSNVPAGNKQNSAPGGSGGKPPVPAGGTKPAHERGPTEDGARAEHLTTIQIDALKKIFSQKGITKEGVDLLLARYKVPSLFLLTPAQGKVLWNELTALPDVGQAKVPPRSERRVVTENQLTRLWAIAAARNWNKDYVHDFIAKEFGLESTKELDSVEYELLIKEIENA